MNKKTLLKLGLITLLGFPIPTFLTLYFLEGISPNSVFDFKQAGFNEIALGFGLGIPYAILALQFMKLTVFDHLPNRIERMVSEMKLTFWECVFLSVCAGVGEELLFRSGVQFYLGPLITSILFVAVHGYLNPMNWRMSLYGIIVLPFIILLSYGFNQWGLWFAVSAHFSYDLILFLAMRNDDTLPNNKLKSISLENQQTTGHDNGFVDLENL